MLKLSGNFAVICEINPSRTQSAASTRPRPRPPVNLPAPAAAAGTSEFGFGEKRIPRLMRCQPSPAQPSPAQPRMVPEH